MLALAVCLSFRLSHGIEDFVLIDVAGVLVMVMVGHLPGVVGYHDQPVQKVAELKPNGNLNDKEGCF